MRIAIVMDWLETYAGAERVVEQLIKLYPQADLFSLVDFLKPQDRFFIANKPVKTSFIQHLPMARRRFRHYLPLFPTAIRTFNLKNYDLIISSSHCVAKGVRTHPGQIHICYCHTPVRYAWDMQDEYLANAGKNKGLMGAFIRAVLKYLREWDKRTSSGVTHFIGNSHFIAARIKACYGRNAAVINPPVATQEFSLNTKKDDFYLTASRLVPYKNIPVIAEAFARMPKRRLVVIGAGPELERLRAIAANAPNVEVMGYQPFSVLKEKMQKARAFVFAAKEDFGITPVEAQACGTPVIAYGEGGVKDSILPPPAKNPTGLFFATQTPSAVIKAVEEFERNVANFTPQNCRTQAEKFSEESFRKQMKTFVDKHTKSAKTK